MCVWRAEMARLRHLLTLRDTPMNWFMVVVGLVQYGAAIQGFFLGTPRLAIMNLCVATANIVLAGAKA